MRRHWLAVLPSLVLSFCSQGAELGRIDFPKSGVAVIIRTPSDADLPGGHLDRSKVYTLAMEMTALKPGGDASLPSALRVVGFDATMPEHRHGMLGKKPEIRLLADGVRRQWEVLGVRLHMTGHWQIEIAVGDGQGLLEKGNLHYQVP